MDKWADLIAFIGEWTRAPLAPEDGVPLAEIEAAEKRLGFPLPEALRELYQLYGQREDITGRQDRLIAPDKLKLENGTLIVWEENQWVMFWGITEESLSQPNPPITEFDDSGEAIERRDSLSLSETALFMIAQELVNAGDFSAVGCNVDVVADELKPAPYPLLTEHGFYYLDDTLFYSNNIASKSREAMIAMRERLGGCDYSFLDEEQ